MTAEILPSLLTPLIAAGSALLGTYQVVREKANSAALVQAIAPTDPLVQKGRRRLSSLIFA